MIKNKNIYLVFNAFLFTHLLIWTLVPFVSNTNLPLDVIEALAWGSNLDWGFEKHPPLSAFFLEIFYQIFGRQDWAYYLLSQIFVIFSFFVVFSMVLYVSCAALLRLSCFPVLLPVMRVEVICNARAIKVDI